MNALISSSSCLNSGVSFMNGLSEGSEALTKRTNLLTLLRRIPPLISATKLSSTGWLVGCQFRFPVQHLAGVGGPLGKEIVRSGRLCILRHFSLRGLVSLAARVMLRWERLTPRSNS